MAARHARRPVRARGRGARALTGSPRSTGCRRSPAARSGCSATTSCAPPSRPSASRTRTSTGVPELALMVTDVLVAFDHLRHEVTVLANVVAEDDVERAYERGRRRRSPTCASAWRRRCRGSRAASATRPSSSSNLGADGYAARRRAREGVHPRGRRLPGGAEPALERRLPGRGVLDLPRPARHQPEPVHVLPRLRGLRDRRRLARVARQGHGPARRAAADRRHAPARRHRPRRT